MTNINNSLTSQELSVLIPTMVSNLSDAQKKQKAAQAALLAKIQANLAAAAATTTTSAAPSTGGVTPSTGGDSNDPVAQLQAALAALESDPTSLTAYSDFMKALENVGSVYKSLSPSQLDELQAALGQAITSNTPDGGTFGQFLVNAIVYGAYASNSDAAGAEAILNDILTKLTATDPAFQALPGIQDIIQAAQELAAFTAPGSKTTNLAQWIQDHTNSQGQFFFMLNGQATTIGTGPNQITLATYLMITMGGGASFLMNSNVNMLYQDMINTQISSIMKGAKGNQLILLMMLLTSLSDDQQTKIGGISTSGSAMQSASQIITKLLNEFSGSSWTPGSAQSFFQQLSTLKALVDSDPAFSSIRTQVDSSVEFFYNLKDANGNTLNSDYQNGLNDNFAALTAGLSLLNPTPGPTPTPSPDELLWQQGVQSLNQCTQSTTSQSSAVLQMMNTQTNTANSQNASLKSDFDSYSSWLKQLADNQIARG